MSRFLDALALRPLVLDAALGTRLLALGLDLSRDDPGLWTLDRPESVFTLHRLDRLAGADVLLTNTFGANPWNLARLHRERDREALLRSAAALAREAAGPEGFVAGCLGPLPDRGFDDYRIQSDVLLDEGFDLLILETQEAAPALAILASGALPRDVPRVVSLFRLPPDPSDALSRLADLGPCVLGVNCVPGPLASIDALAHFPAGIPLLAKPSAAAPGFTAEPPGAFASAVPKWLALGVRLMGGCCGTTSDHVAAVRSALDATGRKA